MKYTLLPALIAAMMGCSPLGDGIVPTDAAVRPSYAAAKRVFGGLIPQAKRELIAASLTLSTQEITVAPVEELSARNLQQYVCIETSDKSLYSRGACPESKSPSACAELEQSSDELSVEVKAISSDGDTFAMRGEYRYKNGICYEYLWASRRGSCSQAVPKKSNSVDCYSLFRSRKIVAFRLRANRVFQARHIVWWDVSLR